MFNITKDVYSVGVLNPNMRIFDIVMKTEYGTSYNSYIVKGNNKIALIDGCHERFVEQFINNIEEITPIDKIDYIIVNHCEPDHTGAFRQLLKKIPNVQIFCTPSSKIFLSEIVKLPLNIHVIKDKETLDLGNKTLEFVVAPFLHWPDSMFTYLKEDKIIFTCDFLGSHYCEPTMLDTKVSYLNAYKSAMKLYYDAIFEPFKSYVQNGLDKLSQYTFDYACTSHGPILTTKGLLSYVINEYKQWSNEKPNKQISIPIIYASSYGYTKLIAQTIHDTILSIDKNIECPIYDANEFDQSFLINQINKSSAFCLGSPTLNKNAVPPITNLLMNIDAINNINKNVYIFGSFGWSGEGQKILTDTATSLRLVPFVNGSHIRFCPSQEQINDIKNNAINFVKTIQK